MYRYQTKRKILSLLLVFSLLILTTVLVLPSTALAQDGEWVWWQSPPSPPNPPIVLLFGEPPYETAETVPGQLDKLILETAPPGPNAVESIRVSLYFGPVIVNIFEITWIGFIEPKWQCTDPTSTVAGTPGHIELAFTPPYVITKVALENNSSPLDPPIPIYLIQFVSPNQAPVADADGPYSGSVGSSITFNGSASFDLDEPYGDQIVSWEWDLNGDGQYDDASGEIVQKSWGSPYSGSIGLNVTDTLGAWDTDETRVNVTPAPTPPPVTEVGGEVYPVNNLAILAPWIALSAAIITGAIIAMKRRRARC